jgi:hypothetical protein
MPPDPPEQADWVFVAHHKTGTTIGKVLAAALCAAAERHLITYTYREAPLVKVSPAPMCHFLIKIYDEDIDAWLDHVRSSRAARLINFVREPSAMVASGYLFHRRGSELRWTGMRSCSRDLCAMSEQVSVGLSKSEVDKEFLQARRCRRPRSRRTP